MPSSAAVAAAEATHAADRDTDSSSSRSRSAKAVLQPVTYSVCHKLPHQHNWQAAVAAMQVNHGNCLEGMCSESAHKQHHHDML